MFSPGFEVLPKSPYFRIWRNDVQGEPILLSVESGTAWTYFEFAGRLDLANIKKYTLPKIYLPAPWVATLLEAL